MNKGQRYSGYSRKGRRLLGEPPAFCVLVWAFLLHQGWGANCCDEPIRGLGSPQGKSRLPVGWSWSLRVLSHKSDGWVALLLDSSCSFTDFSCFAHAASGGLRIPWTQRNSRLSSLLSIKLTVEMAPPTAGASTGLNANVAFRMLVFIPAK